MVECGFRLGLYEVPVCWYAGGADFVEEIRNTSGASHGGGPPPLHCY